MSVFFKRPLDLLGVMAENHVVGEFHPLTQESDKLFTVECGAFYSDTLVVRNKSNGLALVKDKDYNVLYNVPEVSQITGRGAAVFIFMLTTDVTGVTVDYRAVGGKYSVLALVAVDLLKAYENAEKPPIIFNKIMDIPERIKPTSHTHEITDLANIEDMVTAMTKVIESIYKKDLSDYRRVYDSLYSKLTNVINAYNATLSDIETEINQIRLSSEYRASDVIVGDFSENPVRWFPEVDWVLMPDTFLFSHSATPGTDPSSINIANGPELVARTTHIYKAVEKGGFQFSVSRSASSINEGQSVVITISSPNAPVGTVVQYQITGIQSTDVDVPLTGSVTLGVGSTYALTITAVADETSEGNEAMRFTLVDYPTATTSVTINDTSKSSTYEVYVSGDALGDSRISQMNEGETYYVQVVTQNVLPGTVIPITYGGTTTSNDFDTARPTSVTVNSIGRVSFQLKVKADALTEALETLIINLWTTNNESIIVSNTTYVNDTSKTQSYRIFFTKGTLLSVGSPVLENTVTMADEDPANYYRAWLSAENVPPGERIDIINSGTVGSADFVDSPYIASVIVPAPTAGSSVSYIAITNPFRIKADQISEGDETFIVSAKRATVQVASTSLLIQDTSYVAGVKFSSNSLGTNNITTIGEGQDFYLVVDTTADMNGQLLNLTYEGSALVGTDVTGTAASIQVVNQRASLKLTTVADRSTEGDETFRVVVSSAGNVIGVANITILDTSLDTTYNVYYSATSTAPSPITQVNEGVTVYLIVSTSGVPDGTVLGVEQYIGGRLATISNGDVVVTPPSTVTITNNLGVVPVQLRNDLQSEGDELMVATIKRDGIVRGTGEVTVKDTSGTISYNVYASNQSTPGNPVATLIEGQSFYLHVGGTNIPSNTTLYLSYLGSPGNISNLPTSVVLPSGTSPDVSVQCGVTTVLNPNGYTVNAKVYTDSAKTQEVAQVTLNVLSNKRTVTFSTMANGSNTVTQIDEGQTVYLVHTYENMYDGTSIPTNITIADLQATPLNGHISNTLPTTVNVNNGKAIWQLSTILDGVNTGDLLIKALDSSNAVIGQCILRDQDLPTIVTIREHLTSIDLQAYFQQKRGRAPAANEQVVFAIDRAVTVLSNTITQPAVKLTTWSSNKAPILEIGSEGIVNGMGGKGGGFWPDGGFGTADPGGSGDMLWVPEDGGPAIINSHPTIGLIVNNYGRLASGGGGGAMNTGTSSNGYWSGGGGGCPYGKGGALAETATLNSPGRAGYIPDLNTRLGGDGGEFGMAGQDYTDWKGFRAGGKAGLLKVGNVTINTLSGGITRGR